MTPITSSKKKKTGINTNEMALSIAMLEQQADQTTERFEVLGEKFDRILTKVEELALNTTVLNTRHDTQIQVLQRQMASNETIVMQIREDISNMSSKISENVSKEINEAVKEMTKNIEHLNDKYDQNVKTINDKYDRLDNRVQVIEKWRLLVIGGSIVAGAIIMRAFDIASSFITK